MHCGEQSAAPVAGLRAGDAARAPVAEYLEPGGVAGQHDCVGAAPGPAPVALEHHGWLVIRFEYA